MLKSYIKSDQLIFSPDDVDLFHSPMRKTLKEETYVLAAFNPGLCRLQNGNLLLMVRVAEALRHSVVADKVYAIRWDKEHGFVTDGWNVADTNMNDPRQFTINAYKFKVLGLTSLSWLLPVELNENGSEVKHIHYDKVIAPQLTSQEYGIEDARISFIDDRYYMTTCCVSSERHSTMLYVSDDGLNYECLGIILDHQNKDMLLFEGKINNKYYALTRPLGECYFAAPQGSTHHPGPSIQLASSPDLLHWKPSDYPFLRANKQSSSNSKIGGGSQPILTKHGWLMLYHGVENDGEVGIYRTYWALLDKDNPSRILKQAEHEPVLEANTELTSNIKQKIYLNNIVFTTGIIKHEDNFIIASGELDLACRITKISQDYFSI